MVCASWTALLRTLGKSQHYNFSRTCLSDIVVSTFLYDLVFCPHETVTASFIDEVAEAEISK